MHVHAQYIHTSIHTHYTQYVHTLHVYNTQTYSKLYTHNATTKHKYTFFTQATIKLMQTHTRTYTTHKINYRYARYTQCMHTLLTCTKHSLYKHVCVHDTLALHTGTHTHFTHTLHTHTTHAIQSHMNTTHNTCTCSYC